MFSISHEGTASSAIQYPINNANHLPTSQTTFRHIKVTANEPPCGHMPVCVCACVRVRACVCMCVRGDTQERTQ